jgi:V/A-type H+-transporting ATPase subunit D
MGKLKLTKGALKLERDNLRRFLRYLPILQLKKQQLQMEILHQVSALENRRNGAQARAGEIEPWAGLFTDTDADIGKLLSRRKTLASAKNVAGVDLPLFERVEFDIPDYDLFLMPLWVDAALEALKILISLREEIAVLEKGISVLRQELRITAQRVNLFEKVKIPQAEENIRVIKVYLGDQMANAVGRSKIAKRKIVQETAQEAFV